MISPFTASRWIFVALFFAIFATGAHAQTVPLACGDAVTGDPGDVITLNEDIICPVLGLHIESDNITLDCGGHSISGGSYAGIYISGRTGVTVKNCVVKDSDVGIYLSSISNFNSILNNTVTNSSSTGIYVLNANFNTISNNVVTGSYNGIFLDTYSIYNTVDYNTVANNTFNGIYLTGYSSSNAFNHNTIYGNQVYDINSDSTSGNDFTHNYFGGALTCEDRARFNGTTISALVPYYTDEAMTDPPTGTAPNCQPVCGETVYASVTLKESLANCPGDGVRIGADNIVLDCAGYSISGSGSRDGVSLNSRTGVTVKNCNISNFDNGVYLYSSSSNTISYNTLTANNVGISNNLFSNSNAFNYNKLYSNLIYDISTDATCTGDDFTHNYFGGTLTCDDRSRFNNLGLVHVSPYYADSAMTTPGNLPTNCQPVCGEQIWDNLTLSRDIKGCTGTGLDIASNNIVIDCGGHSISGNGGSYGILLNTRTGVTVKNCAVSNFANGIGISGSYGNTLLNNTLASNGNGVFLVSTGYNTLLNNTMTSNLNGLLSIFARYNTVNSNQLCRSTNFDVLSGFGSASNSGSGNICDKPDGWNDAGATGCTYACDADNDGFLYKDDKCPDTYGTIQGCPCGADVTVTANNGSGQQPLAGADVRVFDWTEQSGCAAESRPKDGEFDCPSVNSCLTDASGGCKMGLLCGRLYDVGVKSPPAQGAGFAWHSLGNVSDGTKSANLAFRQEKGLQPALPHPLAFVVLAMTTGFLLLSDLFERKKAGKG